MLWHPTRGCTSIFPFPVAPVNYPDPIRRCPLATPFQTAIIPPSNAMNILEFLTIAAAIVPDRAAIIFEGRRITFERLQRQVNRLANALSKLGLQPGQRVAYMDVNTPELIQTYLACAQLDAIFVPLNYRARAQEISHMLHTSQPTLLFPGSRYQDLIASVSHDAPSIQHVIALEQRPTEDWLFFDDIISAASDDELHFPASTDSDTTLLLFTSGTTGAPKAVKLTHDSFSSYTLSSVPPADPEVEERNLLSLPMYHVAGIQSALAAIYGGRTLLLARQFEAEQWMGLVQREKAHRAGMVPTMLKQVLDHPQFPDYDLSSLRIISYGAAPMPLEVIRRAIESLPHTHFINAFGQTETASTITMLSPEDHLIEGSAKEVEKRLRRLTSVGKALDDVDIAILDDDGSPLPQGHEGEVAARGPRLMSGYWNDDHATGAAFHKNWLLTGDRGYLDEDGYLFLTGRSRDFIKRGGEMVSPQEVEDTLLSHPSVQEAAVIGVSDAQWGERVRALVVPKPGATPTPEDLIRHCHDRLASFKRPESVIFIAEIPKNHMGKVLKRVLRDKYGSPINANDE